MVRALAASLFLQHPRRGFLDFLVIFRPWKDNKEITEGHWFGGRRGGGWQQGLCAGGGREGSPGAEEQDLGGSAHLAFLVLGSMMYARLLLAGFAARVGFCTVWNGCHGSLAHVSGPAPPGSLSRPLTSLYLWSPGQQGFVGSASHTPGHTPKPAEEGEGLRHHKASPSVRSIGKGPVTWRPGESVWLENGRICPAPWRGFPN